MRILITTDTYLPMVNGVVTSICNLRQSLQALGHEVRVLTLAPDAQHSYYADGVYFLRSFRCAVYPNARLTVAFRDPLLRAIERWQPDVIHSQTEFSSFFCAKHLARRLSIPLVHTYHTLYEDYTEYFSPNHALGVQVARLFTRRLSRAVSLLCVPSVKVQDTLLRYRVHAPISILPTGIDLGRFRQPASQAELQGLRRSLSLPLDGRVLLSVGRLGMEKNLDELLENVSPLLRADPSLFLVFVGDGPHRAALEHHVKALGVSSQVRFTGMVPPETVGIYYALGNIFLCASTSETQGLTYFEAMASGLPVVARRDACLTGVLQDGVNGYQYASSAECQAYLRQILADDQLCSSLGARARDTAQRYSLEAFGEHALSRYQALAARPVSVRGAVAYE